MEPAPTTSLRHRTVRTTDGVVLPVVEAGDPDGTPVVLVHGTASSWQAWEAVMSDERLQAGHRLVAFDLRGHGRDRAPLTPEQSRPADPAAAERLWVSDLEAVLEDLPSRHLVGWSFGCSVIQGWVHRRGGTPETETVTLLNGPDVLGPAAAPDPAAGLIGGEAVAALAGAATGGHVAFAERVLRRGPEDTTVPADLLERVAATAADTAPEAVEAVLAYAFDHRAFLLAMPEAERARIRAVVCERDGLFDHAAMLACWEQAGVSTRTVAGEAHGYPLRDPRGVADLLLERLAGQG